MTCEPKWKERSETTTRNKHIPKLKSNPTPDHILIGTSMFERLEEIGECKRVWSRYGLDKLNVFNCGVGGDRIRNILYRLLDLKVLELIEHDPKKILIMAGANDIEFDKVETMIDGMQKITQHVQSIFPRSKIHLIGMFPRRSEKKCFLGEKEKMLYEKVTEYNRLLREYAEQNDIPYHYFGDNLVDQNQMVRQEYYEDLVHLNESGYEVFVSGLADILLDQKS